MITNKAYFKLENPNERNILKKILEESVQEISINWLNDVATLETVNKENFQLQLCKILSTAFLDFNLQVSFLIVPFFNDIFLKYIYKLNSEVASAFEIFIRYIDDPIVKKDSIALVKKISDNDLDTLKAFLKCNANSSLTANELYVHRNTLNYRINHLINDLNIDIRDLNTLMFLNLIINICA